MIVLVQISLLEWRSPPPFSVLKFAHYAHPVKGNYVTCVWWGEHISGNLYNLYIFGREEGKHYALNGC